MKKLYLWLAFYSLNINHVGFATQQPPQSFCKLGAKMQIAQQELEIKMLKAEVEVFADNFTHKDKALKESNLIIKGLQRKIQNLEQEKELLCKEVTALTTINRNLVTQIKTLHTEWD